jgi:hypothetical protein
MNKQIMTNVVMPREGGASSHRRPAGSTEPSRRTGSSAFAGDDADFEHSSEDNP